MVSGPLTWGQTQGNVQYCMIDFNFRLVQTYINTNPKFVRWNCLFQNLDHRPLFPRCHANVYIQIMVFLLVLFLKHKSKCFQCFFSCYVFFALICKPLIVVWDSINQIWQLLYDSVVAKFSSSIYGNISRFLICTTNRIKHSHGNVFLIGWRKTIRWITVDIHYSVYKFNLIGYSLTIKLYSDWLIFSCSFKWKAMDTTNLRWSLYEINLWRHMFCSKIELRKYI